jgi:hypothetical protein
MAFYATLPLYYLNNVNEHTVRSIDFATAGEQNIELGNVAAGQYLLRISDASGKQHSLKISVQ